MKRIYMVQAANTLSTSIYLPYSAGAVIAYSLQFSNIKENYELCDFIFEIKPISEVTEKMENPAIVGFSSYMWNIEFNLELAKAVKEKWPECITIFGGPQVDDAAELLKENRFIDILIHGEGEIPFYDILCCVNNGGSLRDIKNISFFEGDELVQTGREYSVDISDYPSPYTMGLFDKIINDPNKRYKQFDVIVETNRGCPYKCIYCYFAGRDEKFRCFSTEKIKAEFKWMAENKIAYCYCADTNFGLLDRDIDFARYLVELKNEYGYPERFESIATKNKNDVTLEINKILHKAGMNGGISVAVQSMSPKVLKAVGRVNVSFEELRRQLDLYRMNGMTTYTDIILGLPEETYDSFCKGVFAVLEAGQHNALNIFRCELLPNTILSDKSTVEKYNIKTIKSNLCQNHSTVEKSYFNSRSNLIVSTNTLSEDEWLKCSRLSVCVQAFHCFGLSRYIAIYLRKADDVSYYDFYMRFFDWIENESTLLKRLLDETCSSIELFLKGESDLFYYNPEFGNIYFPFEEALYLLCVENIDEAYDEINEYLKKYYSNDKLSELLAYQKDMMCRPRRDEKRTVVYQNDWDTYFNRIFDREFNEPEAKEISVVYNSYDYGSMEKFARDVIWYGKRKDKMIEKDIEVIK